MWGGGGGLGIFFIWGFRALELVKKARPPRFRVQAFWGFRVEGFRGCFFRGVLVLTVELGLLCLGIGFRVLGTWGLWSVCFGGCGLSGLKRVPPQELEEKFGAFIKDSVVAFVSAYGAYRVCRVYRAYRV